MNVAVCMSPRCVCLLSGREVVIERFVQTAVLTRTAEIDFPKTAREKTRALAVLASWAQAQPLQGHRRKNGRVIPRLWRLGLLLRRYFAVGLAGSCDVAVDRRGSCRRSRFCHRGLPQREFLRAGRWRRWGRLASGACRLWGCRRSATWWDASAFLPWRLLRCDRPARIGRRLCFGGWL